MSPNSWVDRNARISYVPYIVRAGNPRNYLSWWFVLIWWLLEFGYTELARIEKYVPAGSGIWRAEKDYIHSLEWIIYGESV